MQFWPVVLAAGIIAVAFALWLARDVLSQDRGTKAMQEVASLIFEGAMAFLNRQYRTIAMFAVIAAVVIGGTSIAGGEGAIWRTLVGILLLALIGNGFNMLRVEPFYQDIVKGAIIVVAVATDAWSKRRS